MPTNSRGRTRGNSRGRGGRNSKSGGRDQNGSVVSAAKDNPVVAAVAVGGVVAAGVFLWSRRNQINDQISSLADQISEWREGVVGDSVAGDAAWAEDSGSHRGPRTQAEISEEALTLKQTGEPV